MSRNHETAAPLPTGEAWQALQARLAERSILIGARRIGEGDARAFASPEPPTSVGLSRARASGAARIVARELIARLGGDSDAPLPRGLNRAPVWPEGFVGSLAHDEACAVAAVARRAEIRALGVDVEPREPLPADVLDFALSAAEREAIGGDAGRARLAFCAKEAVYKAMSAAEGLELDYGDIAISFAPDAARLRDGRSVGLIAALAERCVAVAFL